MCFCIGWMNAPACKGKAYEPTKLEHLANIITHGWPIIPSMFGLYHLIQLSQTKSHATSAIVYGSAVIQLFTISTIFHTLFYLHEKGNLKTIFHYGDRMGIYVFMGGSYTPWFLIREQEDWAKHILWIEWTLCFTGITYQLMFHEQYKWLEISLYVITGAVPAVGWIGFHDKTGTEQLVLGGLAYAIGAIFFKSDGRIPFAHAIWHTFVCVGAFLHYYAIMKYLYIDKQNVILALKS